MTGRLEWTIEEVSEAAGTTSGSMEFECDGDDADACFPVGVDFVSQKGICGVEVSLSRSNPGSTLADSSPVFSDPLGCQPFYWKRAS